jgi:hypothetical protein
VWDMAVLEEFMRRRRRSLRRWCGIDRFQKNLMHDKGVVRLSRIPVLEKSVIEALMEISWLFKTDLKSRWSVPLRSYCDLPWRWQSLLIGDVHMYIVTKVISEESLGYSRDDYLDDHD